MNTTQCENDNCNTVLAKIDLTTYRIESKPKHMMINNILNINTLSDNK